MSHVEIGQRRGLNVEQRKMLLDKNDCFVDVCLLLLFMLCLT